MMAPPSTWVALVKDLRGEGRAVRVSAHAEAGFLVVSTWRAGECVSTVRLLPDEAAHLMTGLAEGLAQLAGAPVQVAGHPQQPPRTPDTAQPPPQTPDTAQPPPQVVGTSQPPSRTPDTAQPPQRIVGTSQPPPPAAGATQPVTVTGQEHPGDSGRDAAPVRWQLPG